MLGEPDASSEGKFKYGPFHLKYSLFGSEWSHWLRFEYDIETDVVKDYYFGDS